MSKPNCKVGSIGQHAVGTSIVEQSRIDNNAIQESRPHFGDGASSNLPRACLYARDNMHSEHDSSIAAQFQAARSRADEEGWRVGAQHADKGVSGTTAMALRAGGKVLLADAEARRFDVLIVDSLDRLSRDTDELKSIIQRLKHLGIRTIGASDDYDSDAWGKKMMCAVRGLINETYLADHREKTHRGLADRFSRGYHIGGIPYGYRSHLAPCGTGQHLLIDPVEAVIVKRIFANFVAGKSAIDIVNALNDEGQPGPHGRPWAVSALVASNKRRTGLLNNEIYVGRIIWNRRVWLRDPVTRMRRSVERPQSEWLLRDSPHLRIVSPHLWECAGQRAGIGKSR